jgi:quinol monooxygenase YgiN
VLLISATLTFIDQTSRDKAVALIAPIQKATRLEEAGCNQYCFAADPCYPELVQVYENWDDGPSLAAHFKHPNYAAMVEALGSAGILKSDNQVYLVAKAEPVYGPNGEQREIFFNGAPEPAVG